MRAAHRLKSHAERPAARSERRFWLVLAIVLAGLGVNKQLDLQSLLTAVARHVAREQGWYEHRRIPQLLFVAAIGVAGCAAIGIGLRHLPLRDRPARLAAAGLVALVGFVLLRAASFHQVSLSLNVGAGGVRIGHLLELGALGLIAAAALGANRPAGLLRPA